MKRFSYWYLAFVILVAFVVFLYANRCNCIDCCTRMVEDRFVVASQGAICDNLDVISIRVINTGTSSLKPTNLITHKIDGSDFDVSGFYAEGKQSGLLTINSTKGYHVIELATVDASVNVNVTC